MYTEVSKYSFSCNKCGKKFSVNGHWYNQWVMRIYLESKFLFHDLIIHRRKITKKALKEIFLTVFAWIPLILFQILDILLEPLRRIL